MSQQAQRISCENPTMKTNRAGRSIQVLFTVVAAVALLAACGSSESSSPTTTTSAPTTSTTVMTDEAAILDAYRQSWADLIAASDPPNPDDTRLAEHTTGKALQTTKVGLLNARAAGHVTRGTIDLAPKLTSVNGDQAVVTDCYFDHSADYDGKTGKMLQQLKTERELSAVTMQRENGAWKVSLVENKGKGCTVE